MLQHFLAPLDGRLTTGSAFQALEIYRNPPTPSHKLSAMAALCAPKDQALLDRTFAFIRSDEVKNQDLANFFAGLANNRESKRALWSFFKNNYDEIMLRFKANFSVGSIVRASFGSFSSEEDAKAVEAFFEKKDTSAFSQPLSQVRRLWVLVHSPRSGCSPTSVNSVQGLDGVRSKAKWLERDTADVQQWLKDNKYL